MAYRELSNRNDVIDSRDVIERIEELEDERQEIVDATYETEEERKRDLLAWEEDNHSELFALKHLEDECSGVPDWSYGETLIRYSYFKEYVQELCEDIGDIPRDIPSYIEIDWEKTADNLKVDYTTVDFDGVEYFVRNC